MFIVIYRWRVRPEMVDAFRAAWRSRTRKIAALRGSHGSCLNLEENGIFCAIAVWPSRAAWEATEPPLADDEADAQVYEASVIERLPVTTMEACDNLWALPA